MYNPCLIKFRERGDGSIKLPEIVNTIEVSGEVFRFEELPENKKQEIALQVQDRIMTAAGYKRKTA